MQRTLDVIADVVRRYDLDGVHIDDYFYPYPVQTADRIEVDFPDDQAWQRYRLAGGQMLRADCIGPSVKRLRPSTFCLVPGRRKTRYNGTSGPGFLPVASMPRLNPGQPKK